MSGGALVRNAGASLSPGCRGLQPVGGGTHNNAGIIHCIWRPVRSASRGRPFSLTGQPNAMGGREVGGLGNLLSAHRDLGNPMHGRGWLFRAALCATRPGKSAVDLFKC
ncbi:MAG: hypothetical protein IPN75_12205 [Dechloromonas sp.]|uniref:Uncharacterized protein n=1 Tax=Candidatus Dechloromonas phosphorivorans TaxID=2899244 RepID=A0A9D7LNG6_9RHOO|nr:hypothetical protein [Candidatus Dechloromonas phosphorivorans]